MAKKIVKTFSLLCLLIITSCKEQTSSSKSIEEKSSNEPPSSLVTSDTSEESESEVINTITIPEESLAAEVKYFHSNYIPYGTTNGNALNNGMAVFDHERELHYFSVMNKVYAYNPLTNMTTTLFTYLDSGHFQNLCLLDDDLYFVASQTTFLYRYSLIEEEVTLVYEEETDKVYGYSNVVFANVKRLNYMNEMAFGLGTYDHNKKATTTKFNLGTTLLNLDSRKLYYSDNFTPTIRLMADLFNGKTSVHYFPTPVYEEMTALQLFDVSMDALPVLRFAVHLVGGEDSGLYLYSTDGDTLVEIKKGAGIHSVNSDGDFIYFMRGNVLYAYNVAQGELSERVGLYAGAKHLFVINHWLYTSNASLTTLYRLHPDTNKLETNFWL